MAWHGYPSTTSPVLFLAKASYIRWIEVRPPAAKGGLQPRLVITLILFLLAIFIYFYIFNYQTLAPVEPITPLNLKTQSY